MESTDLDFSDQNAASFLKYIKSQYIRSKVSKASLYEQLAEEASELAQACLKKARKLRGENYTPKSMQEIDDNVIEEYTDVILSAKICDLSINEDLEYYKLQRWATRIKNNIND